MKKFELNINRVTEDFQQMIELAYNKAEKNLILREALFDEIKELQEEVNKRADDDYLISYNEIYKKNDINFKSLFEKYLSNKCQWNKFNIRSSNFNIKSTDKEDVLTYLINTYKETFLYFTYNEKKNLIHTHSNKFVDDYNNDYVSNYNLIDYINFVVYNLTSRLLSEDERKAFQKDTLETKVKYNLIVEDVKLQYEVYKNGKLEIIIMEV